MFIKDFMRTKWRSVLISAACLVLVSIVILLGHGCIFHERSKRDLRTELRSEILKDSEIKCVLVNIALSKLMGEEATYVESDEYVAKCQNGTITRKHTMKIINGKEREMEEGSVNVNEYMEVWDKLQTSGIWAFKDNKAQLGYINIINYVRIGKKEHRYEVGNPDGVRDARYLKMQNLIGDFLEMKGWLIEEVEEDDQ